MKNQYLRNNRLADVLALIQVLSLDKLAHRSEIALQKELQGKPVSANNWQCVAKEHPEFFRVAVNKDLSISLIARHVQPTKNDSDEKYEKLTSDCTTRLMETAIKLHSSQLAASRWWTFWVPVIGAFVGALLGILMTKNF